MKKYLVSPGPGLLFMVLLVIIGGCSKMDQDNDSAPAIISVYPEDGAVAVPLDTNILVSFSMPMDTASCEVRFWMHVDEADLNGHMMMHGSTTIGGHFSWNMDHTEMMFYPDSIYMDSTMYTYHLDEGMHSRDHDGTMMMSAMKMHGQETEDGIICTFLTENLTDHTHMNTNNGGM